MTWLAVTVVCESSTDSMVTPSLVAREATLSLRSSVEAVYLCNTAHAHGEYIPFDGEIHTKSFYNMVEVVLYQ